MTTPDSTRRGTVPCPTCCAEGVIEFGQPRRLDDSRPVSVCTDCGGEGELPGPCPQCDRDGVSTVYRRDCEDVEVVGCEQCIRPTMPPTRSVVERGGAYV